jgi:hypothetical protein
MDKMNFKNEKENRKFANHYFEQSPIYVGDLIEYKKRNETELGEVRAIDGRYYVGGVDLNDLTAIKRVINMGKN